MNFTSLKIIIFMWQFGLVDTFTAVNFIYNAGAQYGAVVIGAMADGNITKFPGMLFEPIAGFEVSYQFVKAAQTAAERRARVATLAALLLASTATAVGSTPAANAGLGGAVAARIGHMRDVLQIRGSSILGSEVKDLKIVLNSVKIPISEIHPYRGQFTENSKMIISNMFQEHTARRYLQGSAQKIKTVAPAYLAPMASASTKLNTTALIGWTCLSVGLISFTMLGSLYLLQRAKRKRWQNQNDEVRMAVIE
jgi:hypothetical protein